MAFFKTLVQDYKNDIRGVAIKSRGKTAGLFPDLNARIKKTYAILCKEPDGPIEQYEAILLEMQQSNLSATLQNIIKQALCVQYDHVCRLQEDVAAQLYCEEPHKTTINELMDIFANIKFLMSLDGSCPLSASDIHNKLERIAAIHKNHDTIVTTPHNTKPEDFKEEFDDNFLKMSTYEIQEHNITVSTEAERHTEQYRIESESKRKGVPNLQIRDEPPHMCA